MRISVFKPTVLALIVLSGFTVAEAQQPVDSLVHYLEIAAQNNPTVLQRYSEFQAALQKVPQVGSLPDPDLSIGVFLSPMELVGGNQVADIRLMQMFPWFGVLKAAKDEMSLMAKAKYELFRDAKLQVFFDVQRTSYEYQKIQQDIRISEQNIEILHSIERLTLVKFKSASISGASQRVGSSDVTQNKISGMPGGTMGGTSENIVAPLSSGMPGSSMGTAVGGSGLVDLYRIQIEIGELNNSIALLKDQRKTVVARLNGYLNRPMEYPVNLFYTLITDTLYVSLLAASDSILTNNPMLGMLHYEKQSLEARKKMVTRMGYPMVGLGLNYSVINKNPMSTSSMNGQDMVMPVVTLTLPIYRKKYRAMQSEAEFMKTASDQAYSAAANSLQTEYYEAIQQYHDAQRRIILYKEQNELVKRTLEIMVKKFSVSDVILADILRVREQYLDYGFKQIEAAADYNTAIAWIKRLMANSPIQ